MLHSFPGWQMKDICHTHLFLNTFITIGAWLKGLDGVEVGGKKSKFQCAQTQTKSWGQCNFCMILTALLSIYQYTLLFQPNLS